MSTAQAIDFKTVIKPLPTAAQSAVSQITHRILGIAHYQEEDPNTPFDITSKALKGCNSHYNQYLPTLRQVFDISPSYQAKNGQGFCKKYRLKENVIIPRYEYADKKAHTDSIDFDFEPYLVEMIADVLKRLTIATCGKKISRPLKTKWQATHFIEQYLGQEITPQYVAERISLDRENRCYEHKNEIIRITDDIDEFLAQKVKFAQDAARYIFDDIRQNIFFCSISPTNGRGNTSFTSIASCLHKYFRLDGEKIKGLDIDNSQFLILAVILKNCLSKGKLFNFLETNGYMSECIGKKGDFYGLGQMLVTLQKIVLKQKRGADFDLFIELCEQGKIYQYFAAKTGISKRKAKQTFFHILFGANTETKYSKKFEEIFPTIHRIITAFKNKKKNRYKIFSVMLQKVESLLFVKTILPACYALNIPILTKHDSIYAKESQYKQMKKVFNDIMKTCFNDEFSIKSES